MVNYDDMALFSYQVGLMGGGSELQDRIVAALRSAVEELGLDQAFLRVLQEGELSHRNRKSPFVGLFFGYDGAKAADHQALHSILEDSWPIIPVVNDLSGFRSKVPDSLLPVNGIEIRTAEDEARLVSTVLENLRLLRRERRVFISYRRLESSSVAVQLYEALDSRGFDVFLDTHDVRPGDDFQAHLWHRLADSDIVVLLDTPDFRKSEWTVQELTKANATNIQILHLLWPNVSPDDTSAFSHFLPLQTDSFVGGQTSPTARLNDHTVSEVCRQAESLRARALSARYTYVVDTFCDIARAAGADVAVHPQRYLSFEASGKSIAVFPAVGFPTSPALQEFEAAVADSQPMPRVRVVYDERGILERWRQHLSWLSNHLPVRTLCLSDVASAFRSGAI